MSLISSTCITSTTIAGAGPHSFNTCLRCTCYIGCIALPTKFQFNAGPALKPIAGSMPVNHLRRWPSTNLSPGLLYTLRKHVSLNQYCIIVDPQYSKLAVIETALGDCTVFSNCCMGVTMLVTFKITASETPDNTIHWPNADAMLGHVCDTGPTLFQPKPFKLVTTNIMVNIIISEDVVKTKVAYLS